MKNKLTHYYDIHGIIKVASDIDLVSPYFEVEHLKEPFDLSIKVRSFNLTPNQQALGCGIQGEEDTNTITRYYSLLGIKWIMQLRDLDGKTQLLANYTQVQFPKLKAHFMNLISSLLRIKLLEKGYAFLHSACIALENNVILLPGFHEAGKTKTVLSLIREGASYLSDELTIINSNIAYCYPEEIMLTPGNIRNLEKVSFRDLATVYLRPLLIKVPLVPSSILGTLPRRRIDEVIKDVEINDKSKIRIMCFLEKGKNELRKIDKEVALRKLLIMGKATLPSLEDPMILAYWYFNSGFNLEKYMMKEKKLLKLLIKKIDCFVSRRKQGDHSESIKTILKSFN